MAVKKCIRCGEPTFMDEKDCLCEMCKKNKNNNGSAFPDVFNNIFDIKD